MEHVVFFPSSDGAPAFRRLPSFEEAVRLVEHLRNVEGVEHVSVHALQEVPLAFRAYYRVEVPASWDPATWDPSAANAPGQQATAPGEQAPVAVGPAGPVPVPSEPQAVDAEPQSESAPALALVEPLPVPAQSEHAPQHDQAPAAVEQDQAPAVAAGAASNGHGRNGAASLGFFA